MKLSHLFEASEQQIQQYLDQARQERKRLAAQAFSGNQSGVAPHLKPRLDKLDATIAVLKQELDKVRNQASLPTRQFDHVSVAASKIAELRRNRPKREMPDDFGDAISAGFERMQHLLRVYGNPGIYDEFIKSAKQIAQQNGGVLNVEQLATRYQLPPRRMYKILERPEMVSVRHLMPRG